MTLLTSTAYLPPISYMAEVSMAKAVIIEVHETYLKQTCRNHCVIYGPNGRQVLSIPVVKVNGNHTLTKDIRIDNRQRWNSIHWRSIETAYNNSPFFLYYRDYFEPLFGSPPPTLVDFNLQLFHVLCRCLRLKPDISTTDNYQKDPQGVDDRRSVLVSKQGPDAIPIKPYSQVFDSRYGFLKDLSAIDLLFNLGPEAEAYLKRLHVERS